jgi:galactokinase
VSENERTLKAAEALKNRDISMLSKCMAASHNSMRYDFEITVPPIDFIVEILAGYLGEHGGVRMTGGGFGGCIVALMPHAMVEGAELLLAQRYFAHCGIKEDVYICSASNGAGEVNP